MIVSGDEHGRRRDGNDAVMAALADNTDLLNLKSDLSKGTPEIQVTPDPNKAIIVGLTAAQVAQEVRAALVGTVATRIVIDEDGDATDVFVQLDPARSTSIEDLRSPARRHRRQGAAGAASPRSRRSTPRARSRGSTSPRPRRSRAEIATDNTGKVSKDVQAEIDALVADGQHPDGVDVRLAGVTPQMNEAFGGLFISMGVAILVVYVAMVLTFNSLITPFIILFTPPARDDRRPPGAATSRAARSASAPSSAS